MKYIIDGLTKQVTTLARLYKHIAPEDSFLVFDDTFTYPDGYDVIRFTSAIIKDGKTTIPQSENTDTRRLKMTADFDAALKEADCYVNFQSLQYIQEHTPNLQDAERIQNGILERIEKAKAQNKKIYLGNMFSEEFEDVIRNYENCINTLVTKNDLAEMKEYRADVFGAGDYLGCDITMIVGTGMACGKFSCAMDVKAHYEALGEKVLLIHSEETAPLLYNDGTIFSFCRNFSDLTTDEDFIYFQGLIAKLYGEHKPDRIIFVTQAGLSNSGITYGYTETDNGRKMKGIYDILITQSFGVHSVVIAGNWNKIDEIERIIRFYNIDRTHIDMVYFSPMTNVAGANYITVEDSENDYTMTIPPKGDYNDILNTVQGFLLRFPNIIVKCFYADITEKALVFRNTDYYKNAVAALFAEDILIAAINGLGDTLPIENALETKLEEYAKTLSEEDYKKAAKIIQELEHVTVNIPEYGTQEEE